MRFIAFAALLAPLAAVPAAAQTAATPNDPTFTGPRIEAHVGYDRLGTNDTTGAVEGVTYGIGAGYDYAVGGALLGVEVNADLSNTDEVAGSGVNRIAIKAKRDLDASVRVGAIVGSRALLYAKVGYANSRFRVSATDALGTISASDNLEGVRAGLGVEYALSGNSFAKAEYRYTNYEQGVDRNQALVGVGFRF
ncbi:outer membrane protein [Glacieibacterium frigidum]|uniref:Porin family protein n=1 Tax=Glacieibacterium frigidum TaxID=2593303 RepID=A0A552UIS3_9SPHN|nr:outer membrane beta-barrel protein [Glacieibacterium frigidum]TRW18104.1 porin family protein [Glacieibacterium frigidum]